MSDRRCILACLGLLALAHMARAEDAPPSAAGARFGDQGLVISGGTSLQLTSSSNSSSQSTIQDARLALGLDLFVGKGFSIGLNLLAGLEQSHVTGPGLIVGGGGDSLSAAVRGGYVINLGPHFSFYPRVSFGVHAGRANQLALTIESASTGTAPGRFGSGHTAPWIEGDLLFLLHLSPDLFLGLGPDVSHEFDPGSVVQLALALQLGGVIGSGAVATPNDSARERPGFARAGSVVITNELTLSGSLSWRDRGDASYQSLAVSPALDWFVIDNLSLGGALAIDFNRFALSVGEQHEIEKTSSIGFEPRVGYNVPFNEWLSLYVKTGVLFERGSTDLGNSRSVSGSRTALALSLRMIAQVSRHLFIGLGPSLDHDLSRTSRSDDLVTSNRVTTFGLTSTFGGWFDTRP